MSRPDWYDEMQPLAQRCRALASWRTTDSEIREALDEAFNMLDQAHGELVWFRDRLVADHVPRVEVDAFSELAGGPVLRARGWDAWAEMVQGAKQAVAANHDTIAIMPVVDGSGFWLRCGCGEMLSLLDADEPVSTVQEKVWKHRKRISSSA